MGLLVNMFVPCWEKFTMKVYISRSYENSISRSCRMLVWNGSIIVYFFIFHLNWVFKELKILTYLIKVWRKVIFGREFYAWSGLAKIGMNLIEWMSFIWKVNWWTIGFSLLKDKVFLNYWFTLDKRL